jgi:hypothetical protein
MKRHPPHVHVNCKAEMRLLHLFGSPLLPLAMAADVFLMRRTCLMEEQGTQGEQDYILKTWAVARAARNYLSGCWQGCEHDGNETKGPHAAVCNVAPRAGPMGAVSRSRESVPTLCLVLNPGPQLLLVLRPSKLWPQGDYSQVRAQPGTSSRVWEKAVVQ